MAPPWTASEASPALTWLTLAVHALLWVATVITLITGAQYWEQTRKALS